jgi:hypothetical protein
MPEHDVVKFVSGLSGKLAARSRHVCLFLGAGVARACGLPDVTALQTHVLDRLGTHDKAAFERQLEGRNIEQALSRLRRISALLTGTETVGDLTASQAHNLDLTVCQAIIEALDISSADLTPVDHLASWLARANYRDPVELFTVNYDLLLETALEKARAPYFDGFVGMLKARFHTELVEPFPGAEGQLMPSFFVRLWKLHGSVNWAWEGDQQVVRLGQPVSKGQPAAIYPSDTKYQDSRRVPFLVLQDRFRRALYQPETLVLIAGYSFGDEHLNETVFDAAARRERSEFIVFNYSGIPVQLATRALITPNLQCVTRDEAIIGGLRGKWKVMDDPPPGIWTDSGLALCDFTNLAAYMARTMAIDDGGATSSASNATGRTDVSP